MRLIRCTKAGVCYYSDESSGISCDTGRREYRPLRSTMGYPVTMTNPQALPFGVLLKRYRRAAGLTQAALAERAQYSAVYIGMMERGERVPQRSTVEALADALSLTLPERARLLAGGAGQESRDVSVSPRTVSERTRLVGRVHELALLEQHCGLITGEAMPLLLLTGEPGIGKSRLLREAAVRAGAQGLSILSGTCFRHGGQGPYAPILEAVERHVQCQTPAALERYLEGCSWLVRLLPELGEQALVPLPTDALPPEQERRLMFRAVGRYLVNVAGPLGTLLILDDLQWAEADALDLLAELVRSVTSTSSEPPVRIIGAYRDTDIHPEDPLGMLLEDLGRAQLATAIELGPLAAAEANELLTALLMDMDTGADSPRALTTQVLKRAVGVPLFLVSCAQALRAGALGPGSVTEAVPRDLAQGIQQRVAALPKVAQELLGVAAVAGRRVPRSVLLTVVRRSGRSEADTLRGIELACWAGLLVEEGEAGYAFPHDLIHDAITGLLSAARRAMLHRQVAEALESEQGEPSVESLALHFMRAGLPERAVVYLERAGDRASSAQALADARSYYQELVAGLDGLGRVAEAARAREKLAAILKTMAEYDAALEALEIAVGTYQRIGDLEGLARATAHLARMQANRGAVEEGLARLKAQIGSLDEDELSTQVLAEMHVALAVLCDNNGQYAEALVAAERGGTLAESAADIRLQGQAMRLRGSVLIMLGRMDDGVRLLEHAMLLLEAAGELRDMCFALNHMAWVDDVTGRFEQAWQRFDRAVAVAERLGDPALLASMLCNRGDIDFSCGKWERADKDFERARAIASQSGISWVSPVPPGARGVLLLARGQWASANQEIEEAIDLAERTANMEVLRWAHSAIAERELLQGLPDALRVARSRLDGLLDRHGHEEVDVTRVLPLLAWACVETGEVERGRALLAQAEARARALNLRPALALALRVQALMAIKQARGRVAETALEEALALVRAMPSPYAEVKVLYVYGLLDAVKGKPGRAREHFDAALAICVRLGEGLYAEHVEQAKTAVAT
jgi:tetratricopeptide (TPR) repeat protein/transcriptional regulator with XRE-family HTH domain